MANLAAPSILHTMQHLIRHRGVIYDEPTGDESTLGVRDDIREDHFEMVGMHLRDNFGDYVA